MQAAPPVCGAMQRLPPVPAATNNVDAAPESSAYAFAPQNALRAKAQLPCRVVVVGASTTALTALRALQLSNEFVLPHVTVLAPGGDAAAPALRDSRLAGPVLDGSMVLLDAEMVAIDKCAPSAQVVRGVAGT
jgi:hypothetical protein